MSNEFLVARGFLADPFEFTNADEERELAKYFVPPPYFSTVFGDASRPKSTVVLAPRGGGKSAQRRMVEIRADERGHVLVVPYSDFSFATKAGVVSNETHLEEVCRRLVVALLAHFDGRPQDKDKLEAHQKALLHAAATSLLCGTSQAEMESAIRSLRTLGERLLEGARRAGRPVRSVLAASISMTTGIMVTAEDLELEKRPELPPDGWRDTLRGLVKIAVDLDYSSVYVLIDKVDERPFSTQDSTAAFNLIKELVLDLPLLEEQGVAFKFFLWDQVLEHLTDAGFRRDRIAQHTLKWSFEELREMLHQRLVAYSSGAVGTLRQLTCDDVEADLDLLLPMLAQGSPRDMIRLGGRIIAEATREEPNPRCISTEVIWRATRAFCQERAEELFPYLSELRRVGKPTFSMSELASDLLRVHENSARRKVQLWQSTGLVAKVGEVMRGRNSGRPQYVYGVTDPRLLIAMLPTVPVDVVLGNFALLCPACRLLVLDDRKALQCPHCDHGFELSDATTVLEECRP